MALPTTRTPARKASANSQQAQERVAAAAPKTIFVSFPTPSAHDCAEPLQALGTHNSGTTMEATARIVTPDGDVWGNMGDAMSPFSWMYEFNDTLPCGVPLALVVTGQPAGDPPPEPEVVVVPFECNCPE